MAEDDPGEDGDERTIELSALEAIYPEILILPQNHTADNDLKLTLQIQVEPLTPLQIRTPLVSEKTGNLEAPLRTPTSNGLDLQDLHDLSFLPPLTVEFSLSPQYPLHAPPGISLSTQDGWLAKDKIEKLEWSTHNLWEENGRDQVLFTCIDYLVGAAEDAFGIHQVLEVSSDLKVALLDFDLQAKRLKFEKETFECGDFYNTCITEGDVGSVKCLAARCPADSTTHPTKPTPSPPHKADQTLEPSELLQIPLSQETVHRYIKLKRKKLLESDRNTVYCPRQWCQGPAQASAPAISTQPNDNPDPPPPLPAPKDRLAICEDCTFAFCLVCKASWHGEYFTCFPRSRFEITAEERASEEYMKLHTQPCPTCDARAQKTHGCNHMICFKCDTHFCYLCGSYLVKENPYEHFNTPGRPCYMRLWELEAGDDGEFGQGYGGGRAGGVGDFGDGDDDDSDEDDDVQIERLPPVPRPPLRHVPPMIPAPPRAPPVAVAAPADGGGGRGARIRAERNVAVGEAAGLQRFLEMARDDNEDEWDSDEMSDDELDHGMQALDLE
ncbi:MAG: hypothetical protein OHK93_003680 [Ramalina farinacea]|uniref:RBR-type E3 ubiquitin transferase n=1 Tax=Ramalina farinacea TaxID=258253 RepID=A0AA43TUW0_9LECA|nr:hypothetical protein [Ramalina farinacea]